MRDNSTVASAVNRAVQRPRLREPCQSRRPGSLSIATACVPATATDRCELFTEETSTFWCSKARCPSASPPPWPPDSWFPHQQRDSRRECCPDHPQRGLPPHQLLRDWNSASPPPVFGHRFSRRLGARPGRRPPTGKPLNSCKGLTNGRGQTPRCRTRSKREGDSTAPESAKSRPFRQQIEIVQTNPQRGTHPHPAATTAHALRRCRSIVMKSPSFEANPLPKPVIRIKSPEPPVLPPLNPESCLQTVNALLVAAHWLYFSQLSVCCSERQRGTCIGFPNLPFSKKTFRQYAHRHALRTVPPLVPLLRISRARIPISAKPAQTSAPLRLSR